MTGRETTAACAWGDHSPHPCWAVHPDGPPLDVDQAGRETAGPGTCSACGAACERVESGAWWHIDTPCFGTFAWYATATFMPSPPARETT